MIRLIIFDMDGLMLDTERPTLQAYLDTGRKWGIPVSEERYMQTLGMNSSDVEKLYRSQYGENFDAGRLYREIGALRDQRLLQDGIPVKKGLRELLDMLKENAPQIPLTVASGSDRSQIIHNLESTGLADRFCALLSTREVKHGKPNPDVFLTLCNQYQVEPGDTLVFEDSPKGIQAGLDGGMITIAVPDIQPIPEDLRERCYAVVSDLSQALPLVKDLLS